jgi:hypothetical protein
MEFFFLVLCAFTQFANKIELQIYILFLDEIRQLIHTNPTAFPRRCVHMFVEQINNGLINRETFTSTVNVSSAKPSMITHARAKYSECHAPTGQRR